MKATVFNEQRASARKVLKVKAKIVPDGMAPLMARTVDIAASGMCLAVPEPCKPGTHVMVSFDLFYDGKSTPINVRSKISYCILSGDDFKVGLQFLNLDLGGMTMLAKFLR